MPLTNDQMLFLDAQGIPLSKVFDATGLKKANYKNWMSILGLTIAYGVTPCRAAGHTLRTRAGHCVQCGTHNLAFLLRYENEGYLYLAFSENLNYFKIGTASNTSNRIESLRYSGYGGANDWILIFEQFTHDVGRIELNAHRRLNARQVTAYYEREGREVCCQEMFDCTKAQALRVIKHSLSDNIAIE